MYSKIQVNSNTSCGNFVIVNFNDGHYHIELEEYCMGNITLYQGNSSVEAKKAASSKHEYDPDRLQVANGTMTELELVMTEIDWYHINHQFLQLQQS